MPKPWKPFELAVLTSLYRIEQRQRIVIEGVQELLREGPNDQGVLAKIKEEADGLAAQLDTAGNALKAAVEANQ